MTLIIVISIFIGALSGFFILPQHILNNIDLLATYSLYALIFFVGIDVGGNKKLMLDLKALGLRVLLIPLGGILGSLLGGCITGIIFNMTLSESLSIASGFGWYSLSAVMLKELGGEVLGTIAFLTNVFREVLAVILIPIISKRTNEYTVIAPAGATSMDTTLPLISKATNSEITIISFINGAILSSLVPVLVTFFYNIKF